jgi:hypothetical protein
MPVDKVILEMTLTPEDFLRRLPDAVGPFEQEDGAFVGRSGGRPWRLRISELPPNRLGGLALGRLCVEFEFDDFAPSERERFLSRFRLHFHRGGG